MKIKRILSVLIALVMVVGLMPVFGITATPALADNTYTILVQDTPITDSNKNNVLNDGGTVQFSPGEGETPAKLTLTDADISGADTYVYLSNYWGSNPYYGPGEFTTGIIIFDENKIKSLVLELKGESVITGGPATKESLAIRWSGELTIDGDGALTAIGEGTDTGYFGSVGIAGDGPLKIKSGRVTAEGSAVKDPTSGSAGIHATEITIEGGMVTATGGADENHTSISYGIYADKIKITGGTIIAIGHTLALLTNPDISELGDDIAIIVNTEPKAEGAARWDNATPLGGDTSPYKYVRFAKTCTVQFDSNGGAGDMAPVEALAYDEYVLPECGFTAPRGMKFAGWDRGKAGDKIIVEGDVVLKAQWEPVPISIYPPVYPEADPKPELNTADHYAYIIGYPGGEVRPNGDITRAETATIFFRMLTDESRDAVWSTKNSFTDVNEGDWFNNAVSTMENSGIIKGYPDGSFKPNGKITRAEFAAMAIRFFKVEKAGEAKYTDTAGHWAEADIGKAHARGLITGYPDGTFRPDQPITRAEAIAVINRMLGRAPHKEHMLSDMLVWTDNMDKTAWYYADVQEATNSHEYTLNADGSETWVRLMTAPDWSRYE